MLRKRRGRASTILTDGDATGLGDSGTVTTAAKLLGS
jgi:hypothetical protein